MRFFTFLLLAAVSFTSVGQKISDSLSFDKIENLLQSPWHKVYVIEDKTWYVFETDVDEFTPLGNDQSTWPEKNGDYFEYDDEKRLVIYGNYEKNKEEGLFLFFGEDGRVIRSTHFSKGKLDGQAKHYYSNGQLRLSTDYKNGQKHGEILGFYIDGTRLFTGKYKKDKMIGVRMYYGVDGKPANGEMTWRHENGVTKLTGKCVQGKPDGRFTHYDEAGEMSLQVDYLNGLPNGAYIKYENGEVLQKDCYKLGKFTRRPCH